MTEALEKSLQMVNEIKEGLKRSRNSSFLSHSVAHVLAHSDIGDRAPSVFSMPHNLLSGHDHEGHPDFFSEEAIGHRSGDN